MYLYTGEHRSDVYTEHDRSAKALLQRQREATAAKFKASETLAKQARLREKEGKEKARRRRTLINRQRRCLEAAETGGATGYGACAEGEGRNAASTPSLTLAGMDAQAVAADMSPSENIVFSARIHANREDGAAGAGEVVDGVPIGGRTALVAACMLKSAFNIELVRALLEASA